MSCELKRYHNLNPLSLARRWFLQDCAVGLGAAALAELAGVRGAMAAPAAIDPLAPKPPHFAGKAKSVIFLFMAGAPSHLELFDNKPELAKWDGKLPSVTGGATPFIDIESLTK